MSSRSARKPRGGWTVLGQAAGMRVTWLPMASGWATRWRWRAALLRRLSRWSPKSRHGGWRYAPLQNGGSHRRQGPKGRLRRGTTLLGRGDAVRAVRMRTTGRADGRPGCRCRTVQGAITGTGPQVVPTDVRGHHGEALLLHRSPHHGICRCVGVDRPTIASAKLPPTRSRSIAPTGMDHRPRGRTVGMVSLAGMVMRDLAGWCSRPSLLGLPRRRTRSTAAPVRWSCAARSAAIGLGVDRINATRSIPPAPPDESLRYCAPSRGDA